MFGSLCVPGVKVKENLVLSPRITVHGLLQQFCTTTLSILMSVEPACVEISCDKYIPIYICVRSHRDCTEVLLGSQTSDGDIVLLPSVTYAQSKNHGHCGSPNWSTRNRGYCWSPNWSTTNHGHRGTTNRSTRNRGRTRTSVV